MARMMSLEATASYRAVILCRLTGLTTLPLLTYTMEDGTTIDYHRSHTYGPYATESAAKAAVTREDRYLRNYTYDDTDAFVERATTVWTRVP